MAACQDQPQGRGSERCRKVRQRLGERGRHRHQQGAGTCHDAPLCQRERDEGRRSLPEALALAEQLSQADAQRPMAVQLGAETRRPSHRLLQADLRRFCLEDHPRAFLLGNAGLRHTHLHECHLPLQEPSALHPRSGGLHRRERTECRGQLSPHHHGARLVGRQGNLPPLQRHLQRRLCLGQRSEGGLHARTEQRLGVRRDEVH